MKIHELPGDPGRLQKRKRVGRGEGSGLGKTSGKGHKGHQARSGGTKKPSYFEGGQMPLPRRIPKFGFTNIFRVEYEVVNLTALDNSFEAGAVVDVEALKAARLVRTTKPVKILANGTITKPLTIKANAFSKTASEKIAAAGGTTEVV
jgi:large subunit ribosomal protein L15